MATGKQKLIIVESPAKAKTIFCLFTAVLLEDCHDGGR